MLRISLIIKNSFILMSSIDVGLDNQTPVAVTENIGYGPEETRFTGKIDKVVIAVK